MREGGRCFKLKELQKFSKVHKVYFSFSDNVSMQPRYLRYIYNISYASDDHQHSTLHHPPLLTLIQ